MSRTNKTLTILTVSMLVINLVLLSMLFVGKKRNQHRHHKDRKEDGRERFEKRMTNKLGFSEEKAKQYEDLYQAHRKNYWKITKSIFDRKRKINEAIANNDENRAMELLNEIDSLHQVRERSYVEHTKSIFALCDEEQKQKLMETLNRVGEEHRKRRHR